MVFFDSVYYLKPSLLTYIYIFGSTAFYQADGLSDADTGRIASGTFVA